METTIVNLPKEKIENALVKQNVTDAVIKKLKESYLSLKINGVKDSKGYELVKNARLECKRIRVLAEKICKVGREDAIKEQKLWVTKQKEIAGKIKEIEDHLQNEEDTYNTEREKMLLDAKMTKQLPERKKQLAEINIEMSDEKIKEYDDISWLTFINNEKSKLLRKKEEEIKAKEELLNKKEELEKKSEIQENKIISNNKSSETKETEKNKLLIFALQIDNVIYPNVISDKAKEIISTVKKTFERTSKYVRIQSKGLE